MWRFRRLFLVSAVLISQSVFAQSRSIVEASDNAAVGETITISITGTDAISDEIASALVRLSVVLEDVRDSGLDLTTQDFEQLNTLVTNLKQLTDALATSAPEFSQALSDSEATLIRLSQQIADDLNARVVDPSITRVEGLSTTLNKIVSKLRMTVIVAAVALLIIMGGMLIWLGRQLRSILLALRQVTESYVVVPRAQWTASSIRHTEQDFRRVTEKRRR